MKPNTPAERLYNGIIKENPTFVLMLGMCPTLAITTSATNGIGMGLTTTVILAASNLMISLLRNFIPDRVRMPAFIVVVASFVTVVQLLLQGFIPSLYDSLGIYMDENGYAAQSIDETMLAKDASGNELGYAFTVTTSEGYGGDIQFAMGIQDDGTLNGISILSIGETAGLGMRANTDAFKDQFKDKKVDKFEYTKTGATADDQIDALSGATITTNAMTNGVNAGLCAFQFEKGGNQ